MRVREGLEAGSCVICAGSLVVLYAGEYGWICECRTCGIRQLVPDEEIEELANRERDKKEEAQ